MLKTYLVILSLGNGAEVRELATWEECQIVYRELRYLDAIGRQMTALHRPSGVKAPIVGFECRPAENADGTPTS